MPDGSAVFSSQDVLNNLFFFDDLFELPAHQKSPTGLEASVSAGARMARARSEHVADGKPGRLHDEPPRHDASDDRRRRDEARRRGGHSLANVHQLVPNLSFDQAYTPRWAPDGRHLAYSSWTRGGYRDVRIVDATDGSYVEVTHDRPSTATRRIRRRALALLSLGSHGRDEHLAYELATRRLKQVTNVVTGAYQPEPVAGRQSLAYVGYTHEGYDVFVMSLDESQWPDAPPYSTRACPFAEPPPAVLMPHAYNPLLTLQPARTR